MPGFGETQPTHFTQPDSIVPGAGDALAWDRYAYVNYNPIKFVDPSGHSSLQLVNKAVMLTDTGYNFTRKLVGQNPHPSDLESDRNNNKAFEIVSINDGKGASWERQFSTMFGNSVTVSVVVDDIADLYIDNIGASGDILGLATYLDPIPFDEIPGSIYWGLTEGVEFAALGKGILDAFNGNFENFLYDSSTDLISQSIEDFGEAINNPEIGRLVPVFGIIFNIISITRNTHINIFY